MTLFDVVEYKNSYKQQVIDLIIGIQKEFDLPVTIQDQPDLEEIPSFYQKNTGNFWVALIDEQVIGTIALIDIGNNQTALRKMFVKKEYRGKDLGIAQRLMNTLFAWSQLKDVHEIYLGTLPILHAAHRFYEKNGFSEILKNALPSNFPRMKLDTKFYFFELGIK